MSADMVPNNPLDPNGITALLSQIVALFSQIINLIKEIVKLFKPGKKREIKKRRELYYLGQLKKLYSKHKNDQITGAGSLIAMVDENPKKYKLRVLKDFESRLSFIDPPLCPFVKNFIETYIESIRYIDYG